MRRLLLLVALLVPCMAMAQSDPLSSGYKPSVNTTCPNNTANGTGHNIWITDWSQKIVQGNSTAGTNCFQQIYATQGEFGDFQIHLVAPTGGYAGITVSSSSFVCSTGPTCGTPFTIPAPSATSNNIVVHREAYHNITTVTNHSASYYNVTGVYPDALIPAIDPYFHQTTNAFPVAVAASKTQSAWIDVYVPNNAPSGYYLGTITVSDSVAGILAQIPVILAVWQWPTSQGGHMPASSSLRSDTQSGFHDFCAFEAYGTQGNNANCGNYPPAAGNVGNGEIIGQLAGTVMFLDHRLSLNQGNLLPSNYAPWLSGSNNYQFFNTIIPSATMTNVKWSQIGTLQAFQTAMQPYPNTIGDQVVCDEPSAATVTSSCNPACTTAHGTSPPTRCRYPVAFGPFCALATPVAPTNNCNTGAGGENFTDTWVVEQSQQLLSPLGNNGNPAVDLLPVAKTWLNGSGSISGLPRQLWSYVSCASGGTCGNGTPGDTDFSYPSDNIDQRPVGNRAQEWFIFKSGEIGELSFNATCMWTSVASGGNCPSGQATTTDPWTSVYLFGNNGDGTIVYASTSLGTVHHVTQQSGSPLVTEIWIPSIRLKLKRDGLQDYEYLKALTTAGQGSFVTTQINNWTTTLANYDSGTYTGAGLTTARTNIGNSLHALSFGAPPWNGILDPSRAMNWGNAGVLDGNGNGVGNGGAGIPSGTWTQCTPTIAAYTGTAATISNQIATCAANTYVLLGPGTFNLSTGIQMRPNVVVRGSGADTTFIVATGNNAINMSTNPSGPNTTFNNHAVWSSGFAQGTTQITLTSLSTLLTAGQYISLDQQNDLADTGNLYVCGTTAVFPNCSYEGEASNGRNTENGSLTLCTGNEVGPPFPPCVYRSQEQIVKITSVVSGCTTTSCTVNISPALYLPNWSSAKIPGAFWPSASLGVYSGAPITITNSGVENLSIDGTNEASDSDPIINVVGAANCWISGVRSLNAPQQHVFMNLASHITVQNSYFYGTFRAASQSYGIEYFQAYDSLALNNIFQRIAAPTQHGPGQGNVDIYNFGINNYIAQPTFLSEFENHHDSGVMLNLSESNIGAELYEDNFHGFGGLNTHFRNRWNGHECTTQTGGGVTCTTGGAFTVDIRPFWRYQNMVGNVLGTTGIHTPANLPNSYTNSGLQNSIFQLNPANQGEQSTITSMSETGNTVTAHFSGFPGGGVATIYTLIGTPTTGGSLGTGYQADSPVRLLSFTSGSAGVVTWTSAATGLPACTSSCGTMGTIIPADALTVNSLMRWGNYDTANNAVRFVAAEVPSGISPFANPVPASQALPPSFFYTSKPSWWPSTKAWPVIGPDITSGNMGQCGVTSAYPYNNATSATQCVGGTFIASDVGGFANSNPAMDCYLSTMGGPPDGSGNALTFNAGVCYGGAAPPPTTVTLTPATLPFGNQNINTTSGVAFATLTNTGSTTVTVSNVQVTGNFTNSGTGTCAGLSFTLAVGASCTFGITFSPTATTAYTGTLTVTDNATTGGGTQTVNLTGQGTQATIVWSSPQGGTTYAFGTIFVGNVPQSSGLTLQNTGTGPLNVASGINVTVTGTNAAQFAIVSNNCPNPLPAGSSCQYVVSFTPAAASSYTAALTETDSLASNSPQSLTLTGTGTTTAPVTAPWPVMILP